MIERRVQPAAAPVALGVGPGGAGTDGAAVHRSRSRHGTLAVAGGSHTERVMLAGGR